MCDTCTQLLNEALNLTVRGRTLDGIQRRAGNLEASRDPEGWQRDGLSIGNGCMMEQHRAHRAAAQALGQYLADTYGARVTERHDTNRIRMHGIASSGTAGLKGAMHNWVAAAERKIGGCDGTCN